MDREDIREKAIEKTREQLKESADRDRFLVKAAKFLDVLQQEQGEMQHFRDWYSLHFPELEDEITEDEDFLKVLEDGVRRDELEAFESMAAESTGAELEEEDAELLEKAAEHLRERQSLREDLEDYIERNAKELMPNLSVLLGPVLATRLIALAGGLEDLAKSPASTIQMLGAEKALFRHLHGEGEAPKHGVLFQHPFVSPLPDTERGKMARFLANKTAMAARLDQYGDKEKGEELRQEAQEKYEELRD
ncbi:MAG: hypothetical protein ABEI58_04315 [Candidatus Nanohaloarchaea archaeon]